MTVGMHELEILWQGGWEPLRLSFGNPQLSAEGDWFVEVEFSPVRSPRRILGATQEQARELARGLVRGLVQGCRLRALDGAEVNVSEWVVRELGA